MKPLPVKIDPANIELIEETILDLIAAQPNNKNLESAKKLLTTYRKAVERKVRGGISVSKVSAK